MVLVYSSKVDTGKECSIIVSHFYYIMEQLCMLAYSPICD